jgi:hypothetical protein
MTEATKPKCCGNATDACADHGDWVVKFWHLVRLNFPIYVTLLRISQRVNLSSLLLSYKVYRIDDAFDRAWRLR